MRRPPKAAAVKYHGLIEDGRTMVIVEIADMPGVVYTLHHHVKHSPDGFAWGYGGSGPAELARCILIDHFGDDAPCSGCLGREPYKRRCAICGGEGVLITPALYQEFKADVIARLPQDKPWVLTTSQIDGWLARTAID